MAPSSAASSSTRPSPPRALPIVTTLVARSRLTDQVLGVQHDDPVARDLVTDPADVTVITGPAGSGKTVLLHQVGAHAAELDRHAVSVALERSDDQPFALWCRLADASADAVRDHDPAVAKRLETRPAHARGRTAEALRDEYVDAMAELTRPLHLMLDITDTLTTDGGAGELAWLVRHQPRGLRLVLAGRSAPALSTARLRVEGRLLELREPDLRLTVAEAEVLLAASDVTLTESDLATLVDRCEGWTAALRLATIELQHSDDPTAFVDGFSGTGRAIGEFINDEVLAPLSADVRSFLTQTAAPTSLTSELAVELTGRTDAGAVLAELERGSSLVYQVGHAPRTYRYHELLRGHLRARLSMQNASESASLDRRLAHWWADRDDAVLALHHAVSAGAWELVAELVSRHGADLILAGDHDVLLAAFDAAPSRVSLDDRVGTWAVTAAARNGDSATLRRYLDRAWRDDLEHADEHERLLLAMASMLEVQLTGTLTERRHRLLGDLVHEESDTAGVMALIYSARGVIHTWLGNRAEAIADLRRAWSLTDPDRHAVTRADLAAHLSVNAITKGDARQVRMWVDETSSTWDEVAAVGHGRSPWTPWLHDLAAWSAWLRMDRADARRHLDLALATPRAVGDHSALNAAVIAAAIDYDERPEHRRDAVQAIRRAHRELTITGVAPVDTMLSLVSVEVPLALGIGEAGWAEQAMDRLPANERDTADARVLEALILLASGKSAPARTLLASVTDESLSCRLQTLEATAWAMIAYLARVSGEPARAHDFLMRALELTDYADIPRALTFAPIHELLIWERGRLGHLEGLAERIGAARQDLLGGSANSEASGALTARELEVLRDLPSLMPLDQIAKMHVVSTNTVKTHVKSIYRKLGVNGRRAAVDRARSLGLI